MSQVATEAQKPEIAPEIRSPASALPKRQLNPEAIEFVSSRSESEVGSVGGESASPEEAIHQGPDDHHHHIAHPQYSKGPIYPHQMEQEYRSHSSGGFYGWESPQVRIVS